MINPAWICNHPFHPIPACQCVCSIETQTEKAFQRQPTINLNRKVTKQVAKKKLRLSREIGLGFKTPREVCVGTMTETRMSTRRNAAVTNPIHHNSTLN